MSESIPQFRQSFAWLWFAGSYQEDVGGRGVQHVAVNTRLSYFLFPSGSSTACLGNVSPIAQLHFGYLTTPFPVHKLNKTTTIILWRDST